MKTEREVLEEAVRDHLRRALTAVESARIALFDLLHGNTVRPPERLDVDTVRSLLESVQYATVHIQAARTRAGVIDG